MNSIEKLEKLFWDEIGKEAERQGIKKLKEMKEKIDKEKEGEE